MPEAVGSFSPFLASSSFLTFLGSNPFSFKRVREQLDSQYCAILVAFRRIRQLCYVSGSNRPLPLMYIGLPFPFLRHLSSSCLSKSFSLLHSRCHWLPLAMKKSASRQKNATKVQKSTRRRNRVLTQIHLIYSVIRAASNEHSNEIPLPGRGRSAALENICAPLHMDSYPAPIPRNSAPIAPRFRRLSPKLAPG